MNSKSRIASILSTKHLDVDFFGLSTFALSMLNIESELDFHLPENLRLGHLAEAIVSESIRNAENYDLLYENVQIEEDKRTIGELDFIIRDKANNEILHLELAYKFYLLDPSISSDLLTNWIGPNRKDNLKKKLEKVKSKQFPLLYHKASIAKFSGIEIDKVSQVLCLLASLFIPFQYQSRLPPLYAKCVKGYYINIDIFLRLQHMGKFYYLPSKKEWGMKPSENKEWTGIKDIEKVLEKAVIEKQAYLCWEKNQTSFHSFFLVWW